MPTLRAGRTDSIAEKVKVCNTCGDAGFDDCLAFCSHCNEGAEHVYCMVTVFDTVPLDWICEGCKVKQRENSRKRRLVCDGLQLIRGHKKQLLSNNLSAEKTGLSHISPTKKEFFENGTKHFTMQDDEAASKCVVQSMGPIPWKEISERDQLPFTNKLTKKLKSSLSNEKNSACIVSSYVRNPAHSVISSSDIPARVSSCSETDELISTSKSENDIKQIAPTPESFTETTRTLSNSQSASIVARIMKEPSCAAEPLESVFVQDTSAIAIDGKICDKKVGSDQQELNNAVLTSLAKDKQPSVKAEPHNLKNKVAAPLSSVAKPLATEKEEIEMISGRGKLFEAEQHNLVKAVAFSSSSLSTAKELVSSRTGKLVPIDRTTSLHKTSMAESSIHADAEIPKHTLRLIERPTCIPQLSIISSTPVKSETTVVASESTTGKGVPVCTTSSIRTASIVHSKNVSADEGVPNDMDIAIEEPTSSAQDAIINCMSLKGESMKGSSSIGTDNVVSACRTAPKLTGLQHAVVDSMSDKNELDELVERSRMYVSKVTRRDFPIISQKLKVLGEKGEKVLNCNSKGKLLHKAVDPPDGEGLSCSPIPGGNEAMEETATGQEMIGSGNKLQTKEEVKVIDGPTISFNLFCKGEEHHQSGDGFVKAMTTGQETDGSHNRLKAKEEKLAVCDAVKNPSSFVVEENALPEKVMHKCGVAGSVSCLISGPGECPSLFSKNEKAQPLIVKQKGEISALPSCLMSGLAGPPSEKEEAQPQHVEHKDEAAGSKAVPRQENSMSVASGGGVHKISGIPSKRVVRRDFPPLKVQCGEVGKIVGPTGKEKVTTSLKTTSLKDKEQATGSRLDADTARITIGDVPATNPAVPPSKLKNGPSAISTGNLAGVMTPSEDEKGLSCPLSMGDVLAEQMVSIGIDTKVAVKRLEAEEVSEKKESSTFRLRSLDTRPECKECHGNARQECDATGLAFCVTRELPTGLASCVTRELPTNGVSSAIGDEVASVIMTVPTSFESASKRKPTMKNLSTPPCKEGTSSKGAATLKRAKGPLCLPGQMEGVAVKDTSNIQLIKSEVSGRGPLSRSDDSNTLLTRSIEGEHVEEIKKRLISRQKREAREAVAASSCEVRPFSNVPSEERKILREESKVLLDKVTFTGRRLSSIDADHDCGDRDYSDRDKISPGRHASRSQCHFNRTACMMDGSEKLFFSEPRLKDSPRWSKGTVRKSISSTRNRHGNATYIERDSEDNGFHARREDVGCEPSDWMDLRKSTWVRPKHHTLPDRDVDFRSAKQACYPRGSKHQASESSSYKGAYRCQRCDAIGHSAEFCKADGKRTLFSSDFDDRDLDLGYAKRDFMGFQVSDGKQWKYDPRREDRFPSSRSRIESDAVDGVRVCLRKPLKVSGHARYDEERRYKLRLREEEESFEREPSRSDVSYSLNGMVSELKPSSKQSEYSRVHKRQIVRVQNQDSCKADSDFENGRVFRVQGNASSLPAGPTGAPRGGYVNRPLLNQVAFIPQDQVCKDRISQYHVASQLHGSSIRNFAQERRAAPDRQVMWTGCLNVFSKAGYETLYQGFQARPSNVAHSKVFEALLALPLRLKMEEKKRGIETDSWPRSFQESPPTSHSIGVYFFSTDSESYGKWYKPLLRRLATHDLALQVKLDFAQLLIFPSHILPEAEQCWEDRFFLWGIFRRNVEDSSHLLCRPCRDPGSDLGSPTGNGEVIDMDVDMVRGKDATSREWQEFNPSLPPGFPPTPPYPP